MATIGGDRDKLLKAFLSNDRRKRKPGRVNLTTPRKGEGEGTTYSRFATAKRKPPKDEGPPVRAIPGYGQYVDERIQQKIRQDRARHDYSGSPRPNYGAPLDKRNYRPRKRRPRLD